MFSDLLKQNPWFYQSPNPLTLLFWALMAWHGSRQLLAHKITFKRYSRILRFTNALFIAGIPILIHDLFFLTITAIRWVPVHPQYATLDFWLCFPRDLTALALCLLLTWEYQGHYSLNRKTWIGFISLWIWTAIIFSLTPTLGITNWTFAITQGMPDQIILVAFMLNFAVGKPWLYWIYTTMWENVLEESSITINNHDRSQ